MWPQSDNDWGSSLLKAPLGRDVFQDGFLAHTSGHLSLGTLPRGLSFYQNSFLHGSYKRQEEETASSL